MGVDYESILEAALLLTVGERRRLAENLLGDVGQSEGLGGGLADEVKTLSERELLLLRMYLEGHSPEEIAEELNTDPRLTRYEVNALRSKVRYRLRMAAPSRGRGGGARRHFGAWDSGDVRSADNDRIDHDLAGEYDNSR